MNTNPQLTVSDLYTGELPVLVVIPRRALKPGFYPTQFIDFGETQTFSPKIIIPYHLSTSTIQLLQTIDWYSRLHKVAKGTPTKRAESEFIKDLKNFKIRLHDPASSDKWYVLD